MVDERKAGDEGQDQGARSGGEGQKESSGLSPALASLRDGSVDELLDQGLAQEALKQAEAALGEARRLDAAGDGNGPRWVTRALVARLRIQLALSGFATALQDLREAPWPEGRREQLVLELHFAEALKQYYEAYSWDIQQREQVADDEAAEPASLSELETWSAEVVAGQMQQAYARAYALLAGTEGSAPEGRPPEDKPLEDIPLGSLGAYLETHGFPAGIRDTARDAVTYLWIDSLQNSSWWDVSLGQQRRDLDLGALGRGELPAAQSTAAVIARAEQHHPLLVSAALLHRLESWHRESQRPEATFEALRRRVGALWAAGPSPDEARQLLDTLQQGLDELGSGYPWWSYGMADLAQFTASGLAGGGEDSATGGSDPRALQRALEIAQRCQPGHRLYPGGRRCARLEAQWLAPGFDLMVMGSDLAGRRSVEIRHRNLERICFRLWRLDFDSEIQNHRRHSLLPHGQELEHLMTSVRPDARWCEDLPATPDLRMHRTFLELPEVDDQGKALSGLVVLGASVRQDFRAKGNRRLAAPIVLTPWVLVSQRLGDGSWEVTVRDGDSGAAVSGAQVALMEADWRQGHREVAAGSSGEDGRVRFEAPESKDPRRQRYAAHFLLARGQNPGERAVDESFFNRRRPGAATRSDGALLFTDRAVYRPGQELLWKTVLYQPEGEARWRSEPGAAATVELLDANGEVVDRAEVVGDAFGSASGRFTVPRGRLLGDWTLRVQPSQGKSRSQRQAYRSVRVEEYERPTFTVELHPPAQGLALNHSATITGEARYYFGLPVVSGEVRWRVERRPLWRWLPWEYGGAFGGDGALGRGSGRLAPGIVGDPWPTPGGDSVVATGSAAIDQDGGFRFTFTPEADPSLGREAGDRLPYAFRLVAELTDDGGETREGERTVRAGPVAVVATVEADAAFGIAGKPITFSAERNTLDGEPAPGSASWELWPLDAPSRAVAPAELPVYPSPFGEHPDAYQTPGDLERPRWQPNYDAEATLAHWPLEERLAAGQVEHGARGEAKLSVGSLPSGTYRLRYRTTDSAGGIFETETHLVVAQSPSGAEDAADAGEKSFPLPLLLRVDRRSAETGETVTALVASGLPQQPLVLEAFHRGQRVWRRTLQGGGAARLLPIAVEPELRGGFALRLSTLVDYQWVTLSERVAVPWSDRELDLELVRFRDTLAPGEEVSWSLRVRGSDGEPVAAKAAQVLAYLVDKSLELFGPLQPPRISDLYPDTSQVGPIQVSVTARSPSWRSENDFHLLPPGVQEPRGDTLRQLEGISFGGPGVMTMALAAPMSLERVAKARPEAQAMEAVASFDSSESDFAGDGLEEISVEAAGGGEGEEEAVAVRSDFSETALWAPALLSDEEGTVELRFTVPESLTEWDLWAHAHTADFSGGELRASARTVKDLLVRPYLPRFLREGDQAVLAVTVQNASDQSLEGELWLTLTGDDEEGEVEVSRAEAFGLDTSRRAFEVEAGGATTLEFPVRAPLQPGAHWLEARARARHRGDDGSAGSWVSDGERRALPLLPGRIHLSASRFAVLGERDRRTLVFEDPAPGDGSVEDESLVVTVDGQLLTSVLAAVPYVLTYPYDCTEQLLNRYLAVAVVEDLFRRYPGVARRAAAVGERETPLEAWNQEDPNRQLLLEESPWLLSSRGGSTGEAEGLDLLDSATREQLSRETLQRLREAQTDSGGFPWWPGGPPSPYITAYLLEGFARASAFGVEAPRELVAPAWSYLHGETVERWIPRKGEEEDLRNRAPMAAYLAYVLTRYPDLSWTAGVFSEDDVDRLLEIAWTHRREQPPRIRAYLAMALAARERRDQAVAVLEALLGSAREDEDQGIFWAPEERSWLWYNDTLEGHTTVLAAMLEVAPEDRRRYGLAQWLLLNKTLNHWKSTRATAEALWVLTRYLEQEGQLEASQRARIRFGESAQARQELVDFPVDEGITRRQIELEGEEITAGMGQIEVQREGKGFLFASATWRFATNEPPSTASGDFLRVERRVYRRSLVEGEWRLEPLAAGDAVAVGDQLEVELTLGADHEFEYVHLRDPRPAGFEPDRPTSGYRAHRGLSYFEEVRDSATNFFLEWLPRGEATLRYRLRAATAGRFQAAPATLQALYAPQFTAYSAGGQWAVEGAPSGDEERAGGN
ncbi:MAG: alpha-2-macroglobulin family protein [Acidobacteriota bacterium]